MKYTPDKMDSLGSPTSNRLYIRDPTVPLGGYYDDVATQKERTSTKVPTYPSGPQGELPPVYYSTIADDQQRDSGTYDTIPDIRESQAYSDLKPYAYDANQYAALN